MGQREENLKCLAFQLLDECKTPLGDDEKQEIVDIMCGSEENLVDTTSVFEWISAYLRGHESSMTPDVIKIPSVDHEFNFSDFSEMVVSKARSIVSDIKDERLSENQITLLCKSVMSEFDIDLSAPVNKNDGTLLIGMDNGDNDAFSESDNATTFFTDMGVYIEDKNGAWTITPWKSISQIAFDKSYNVHYDNVGGKIYKGILKSRQEAQKK